LARVAESFVVHILVKQRERKEILGLRGNSFGSLALIRYSIQNLPHVSKRLCARRQRQIPARIMRDPGRVVERVTVWQYRRAAIQVSQHPILLKPGDVADFPQQRINYAEPRSYQLLVS
jgi:hypothetical protein